MNSKQKYRLDTNIKKIDWKGFVQFKKLLIILWYFIGGAQISPIFAKCDQCFLDSFCIKPQLTTLLTWNEGDICSLLMNYIYAGSTKVNRTEPKSYLGRVFNFRLVYFKMHVTQTHIHACLELNQGPGSVLATKRQRKSYQRPNSKLSANDV